MKRLYRAAFVAAGFAASAAAAAPFAAGDAAAKEYLVALARPGHLYAIDAASREIVRDCALNMDINPGVIAIAPESSVVYALVNRWQDVIGVDLKDCSTVFHAAQSDGDVTRRSIGSLAVSKDGTRVYTVRNPVRHLPDRLEVLEPEFAVFNADAGLEATPSTTYPAPRRSTVMQTDANGTVYIAGHDIFAVDPENGAVTTVIANAHWDRPAYGAPDVLAFWPVGTQNDDFLLLYTAAKYADETHAEDTAEYIWGYSAVKLDDGRTEIRDFAPLEVLMFSAVRNPAAPNELFGVYTQLSKHDLDSGELIKRVDLPHTYYVLNISKDGKEVYVGGTNDDIGVYDGETLERIDEIRLPSGGDQGTSTVQIVDIAPLE